MSSDEQEGPHALLRCKADLVWAVAQFPTPLNTGPNACRSADDPVEQGWSAGSPTFRVLRGPLPPSRTKSIFIDRPTHCRRKLDTNASIDASVNPSSRRMAVSNTLLYIPSHDPIRPLELARVIFTLCGRRYCHCLRCGVENPVKTNLPTK